MSRKASGLYIKDWGNGTNRRNWSSCPKQIIG